jgi:hypothetical protein
VLGGIAAPEGVDVHEHGRRQAPLRELRSAPAAAFTSLPRARQLQQRHLQSSTKNFTVGVGVPYAPATSRASSDMHSWPSQLANSCEIVRALLGHIILC